MAAPFPPPTHDNSDDPFDTLLTLEDTLYTTAYTLGTTAGSLAGRIEGRIFGLENGFEKFAALGALHGRGVVWASRLPSLATTPSTAKTPTPHSHSASTASPPINGSFLPHLTETPRLTSNTTLLHALTDPLTFSTSNTEEAVADFDDRCKRASAKAKVIERIVGENAPPTSPTPPENTKEVTTNEPPQSKQNLAPTKTPQKPARRANVKVAGQGPKKGDDSIEDFTGSRFLR